jgi:hypothetical protein
MIATLVHFGEIKTALGLDSSRAVKATCARYGVPVIALNKRQLCLRATDYEALLSRATLVVANAD